MDLLVEHLVQADIEEINLTIIHYHFQAFLPAFSEQKAAFLLMWLGCQSRMGQRAIKRKSFLQFIGRLSSNVRTRYLLPYHCLQFLGVEELFHRSSSESQRNLAPSLILMQHWASHLTFLNQMWKVIINFKELTNLKVSIIITMDVSYYYNYFVS